MTLVPSCFLPPFSSKCLKSRNKTAHIKTALSSLVHPWGKVRAKLSASEIEETRQPGDFFLIMIIPYHQLPWPWNRCSGKVRRGTCTKYQVGNSYHQQCKPNCGDCCKHSRRCLHTGKDRWLFPRIPHHHSTHRSQWFLVLTCSNRYICKDDQSSGKVPYPIVRIPCQLSTQ